MRVIFVADGGEAFIVVFAGAVVKGEDLCVRGLLFSGCLVSGLGGRVGLFPKGK